MHISIRQQALNIVALVLLSLFSGTLYFVIAAHMEERAFKRLCSLARIGAELVEERLALRLSLATLAERMAALESFNINGRKFFLINEANQLLIPVSEQAAPSDAAATPMLQGLPAEKNTAVRHLFAGEEYLAVRVPVKNSGLEFILLSPSSHDLCLSPFLLWSFGGIWLCLCASALLLLRLRHLSGHYKMLSEVDHLTGAGNRLAFEKSLNSLRRQKRLPLCLILVDVDGLKLINDKLGHQAGDALLRRLMQLLHRSLRENDAIYRIGGDEFAVIVPDAVYSMARPLTERINRQARLMREKDALPPVFISSGLAEARDEESLATLFARADMAMYGNKDLHRKENHKAILHWLEKHPNMEERRKSGDSPPS